MSSLEPSPSSRPLRLAAFILLGISAVAMTFGIVSLTTGDNTTGGQAISSGTAGPSPSAGASTAPRTSGGAASSAPNGQGAVPGTGGTAPGSPSGDAQGGTNAPAPGNGDQGQSHGTGDQGQNSGTGNGNGGVPGQSPAGGGQVQQGADRGTPRPTLRVYNNSTIERLAARAASEFRAAGWQVDEVGNYPGGVIPTTTVYYRPGTAEQAAAEELGRQFGIRVEPRFDGIADASPGLIVIVTNDYRGPVGGAGK
ncbi:LytR cell envelope-related transcriptional attenuator [Streptoalloteichus tenebrarius]|uniref:LytR cell envelope-related transcriptional attenuator n=1 Tax=Streptoalloteichus tenebrarius (strain ATCC 17920 / DSM 40477 / JCM 4838 / CBS 697.72 / NBRC 16177 / NCIMB 11028 / NRRL B-12390 / A12253. 1 / ISP 5477) TaxID=1933 RepID=A0ABT1HYK3_STRSD|nr:LytR C-terminal domain-containing protein [Streptoalloteichus tenebrarius]MCP2260588.1 LytR cell envelope-related transcriptional attenuator [Streptoalloteichus tenebrarius]BFF01468.1 LytR C-terminal domain-containing protein [Streptoalloteichus tenebrarius]